jgi:hypothetical protein
MSGGESHSAVSNSKCLLRVKSRPAKRRVVTSAFSPRADIGARGRHVPLRANRRLLHRSKIGPLFDHLVSKLLKLQRHINPDCVCGLQIDYEIKFDRLFDW